MNTPDREAGRFMSGLDVARCARLAYLVPAGRQTRSRNNRLQGPGSHMPSNSPGPDRQVGMLALERAQEWLRIHEGRRKTGYPGYKQALVRFCKAVGWPRPPRDCRRAAAMRELIKLFVEAPTPPPNVPKTLPALKAVRSLVQIQETSRTAHSGAARLPHYEAYVNSDAFLRSSEWRRLRYEVLKRNGGRCQCCGATAAAGNTINVDHIKPRRRFPELALAIDNLQVLCGDCNAGKGNWDETDWRPR